MQLDNMAIGGAFAGQLGNQLQQEHPLMAFYRDWVAAKQEFDDACHNLALANERKAKAHERLGVLVDKAAMINGQALDDPTVPKPAVEYQNGAANKSVAIGTQRW